MDSGDLISPINIPVSGYINQNSFNVTGLTSGVIYRFVFLATNNFGNGDVSPSVAVQAVSKP